MSATDPSETNRTTTLLDVGQLSGNPLAVMPGDLAADLDTWIFASESAANGAPENHLQSKAGEAAGTMTGNGRTGLYRSLGMVTERDRRTAIPATYDVAELNRLAINAEIEEMLSAINP